MTRMVNRVMILGSINVDSIYQVTRFPQPGETIAVKQKSYAPGVKEPIRLLQQLVLERRFHSLVRLVLIMMAKKWLKH